MSWRLLSEHAGPENVEEVVLCVQGVIAQKDLPPLTNRPAYVSLIQLGGVGHCYAWHVRVPFGNVLFLISSN